MFSLYPQSSNLFTWRWRPKASLHSGAWACWKHRHGAHTTNEINGIPSVYKQLIVCRPAGQDYGGGKQAVLYLSCHTLKFFLILWIENAPMYTASWFYWCLFNLYIYWCRRFLGFVFNLFHLVSFMYFLWAGAYIAAWPFIFWP